MNFDLGGLQLFHPQWTAEMTAAAVACVPSEERSDVRSRLLAIQERTAALFEPHCLISGDPNPTNWGLRADGTVVLFDWERFGLGAPALDVAISMPGLPSPNGGPEERVASRYLEFWAATGGEPPATVRQFAADIRRAKLWTIVEFLEAHASGELPAEAGETAAMLAAWLPQGVRSID
jgi:aminoglycoside phosphotransferase (APT) family kinase protein